MLVVVELHQVPVDVRLQRTGVVGKVGQRVGLGSHGPSPSRRGLRRGVPSRCRPHTGHRAPGWRGGNFGPVGAAFDPAGHGGDEPPTVRGRRGGGRVAPAPMRAAVALASSLLVGIGVFLPWQIVHFEDQRRSFRGWNLAAGDARACVVFALDRAPRGLVADDGPRHLDGVVRPAGAAGSGRCSRGRGCTRGRAPRRPAAVPRAPQPARFRAGRGRRRCARPDRRRRLGGVASGARRRGARPGSRA